MDHSLAYTPERGEELKSNLDEVLKEIDEAKPSGSNVSCIRSQLSRPRGLADSQPRLVAISKIKPPSDIQALYDAGHRHFGENYIQELAEKAPLLPKDICWHFVGSLQSNKSKMLAAIPNLFVLETLSSEKLAGTLQKALHALPEERTMRVYLQVNTSGEDNKSGLPPLKGTDQGQELAKLALHVVNDCDRLELAGVMTIGSFEHSHAAGENPDFLTLKETKKYLEEILKEAGKERDLEISMGMSADFVEAVKEGSSSVRVGTRIFGARPKKK